MKKAILILSMLIGIASAHAQIPAEVTTVMNKCRAAMSNANGLEYEMDMKAGMGPVSMKMHFVVADKGKLNRTTVITKILGMEVTTESGFDGTDTWEIKHYEKSDTITFTRGNKSKKGSGALDLDLDKQYNKAKLKLKDGYHEITFSDPKDKSCELKSVDVKISAKNHTIREVRGGARGAKVTMTVTKIRVGLPDSHFKPNLTQYPNAVVIRK
ncbi:MAG: hypothetical protein K6E93_05390 [Bacteroidales bacterium]|nr:hypothetical protein [Bacteroidales bacterium]